MSQQHRQKNLNSTFTNAGLPPAEENTLEDTRANIDRLFAQAAENFENLHSGDSRQFLERSRQTGGQ